MSKNQRVSNFKDIQLKTGGNVVAVVTSPDGNKEYWYSNNIVTNQGDRYYASTICGTAFTAATSTTDFKANNWMRLGTSTAGGAAKTDTDVGSVISGGSVQLTGGYPQLNASLFDSDNTGGNAYNIVSWGYTFGTGVANVNSINEGAVTGLATGGGTCLTHFFFGASFNKTSADTLKIFVNHQFSGV